MWFSELSQLSWLRSEFISRQRSLHIEAMLFRKRVMLLEQLELERQARAQQEEHQRKVLEELNFLVRDTIATSQSQHEELQRLLRIRDLLMSHKFTQLDFPVSELVSHCNWLASRVTKLNFTKSTLTASLQVLKRTVQLVHEVDPQMKERLYAQLFGQGSVIHLVTAYERTFSFLESMGHRCDGTEEMRICLSIIRTTWQELSDLWDRGAM